MEFGRKLVISLFTLAPLALIGCGLLALTLVWCCPEKLVTAAAPEAVLEEFLDALVHGDFSGAEEYLSTEERDAERALADLGWPLVRMWAAGCSEPWTYRLGRVDTAGERATVTVELHWIDCALQLVPNGTKEARFTLARTTELVRFFDGPFTRFRPVTAWRVVPGFAAAVRAFAGGATATADDYVPFVRVEDGKVSGWSPQEGYLELTLDNRGLREVRRLAIKAVCNDGDDIVRYAKTLYPVLDVLRDLPTLLDGTTLAPGQQRKSYLRLPALPQDCQRNTSVTVTLASLEAPGREAQSVQFAHEAPACGAPVASPKASLLLPSGERVALGSPCSIGADAGNDIRIIDTAVSPRHLTIYVREGVFMVKDHGSEHGTWIQADSVKEEPLRYSTAIRVGRPEVFFELASPKK